MNKLSIEISDIKNMVLKSISTILNEGTSKKDYSYNKANNSINVRINTSQNDRDNAVSDTRIFGDKNDIIYGDKTRDGRSTTLGDRYEKLKERNDVLSAILQLVNSREKIGEDLEKRLKSVSNKNNSLIGLIEKYNENPRTRWKYIEDLLKKNIENLSLQLDVDTNKINRISSDPGKNILKYQNKSVTPSSNNGKSFRYNTGTVPDTNIEFISLFSFNDFNFSDMVKNGYFRQTDLTDDILGISKDYRQQTDKIVGKNSDANIKATYDDEIDYDLLNNFSLDNDTLNGNSGHYKKQFGLMDKNYTSVTKLMDKSVMYAKAVLDDVGYHPSLIVSTPSSSKYNEYYCTNLSRKLGIPYMKNFFERNVIGMDYATRNQMESDGVPRKDIDKFERTVKRGVLAEIYIKAIEPINQFIEANKDMLSRVPNGRVMQVQEEREFEYRTKGSKNKKWVKCYFGFNEVSEVIKAIALKFISNNNSKIPNLIINEILFSNFFCKTLAPLANNKATDIEYRFKDFLYDSEIRDDFFMAISKAFGILKQYSDKILGGKLNAGALIKFKITYVDKRFRKYIKNMYIVAKEYLNKYGKILSKFANANILIFDEDVNSGTSLKLSIDAIRQKLPDKPASEIKCLVNGFSSKG